VLVSLADFEAAYGGAQRLSFGGTDTPNYAYHAARAFFEEGGRRLYFVRVADTATVVAATGTAGGITVTARFGGRGAPDSVTLGLDERPIAFVAGAPVGVVPGDVVYRTVAAAPADPPAFDVHVIATPADVQPGDTLLTLTVAVTHAGRQRTWNGQSPEPKRRVNGVPSSLTSVFSTDAALDVPVTIATDLTGDAICKLIRAGGPAGIVDTPLRIALDNGADGAEPDVAEYEAAIDALETVDEISIVAAPGVSAGATDRTTTVHGLLIAHAERMKYRIALVDAAPSLTPTQVQDQRGRHDTTHAAMYYPWVTIVDPLGNQRLDVPPSGFIAGVYARTDINRGVWKAPANEVVNLAVGFERAITSRVQEVLNPRGINCLRSLENRGNRVWGARTMSSDPEWKYVDLRRYFTYVERSIDIGTQWAVFEPNGERLWGNVRRTVSDFLLNEFQSGALLGDKPEKAYFVKCDRTTMTQNDIDNGRLVCLIGIAALKPAEFVVFRIGQWTADAK